MVGTSAIRSPAARHRMTARRNADTVRTTRMGMGADFVGLGSRRANYQSGGGEATCAALRWHTEARALRRKPDMATLWAGVSPVKCLLPWPTKVNTAHRRIPAAHRRQAPRARRSTRFLPR